MEKTLTEGCKFKLFYLISSALYKITFQVYEYDVDTTNATTVQFFFFLQVTLHPVIQQR